MSLPTHATNTMAPPDTITITEQLGAEQVSTGAEAFIKTSHLGLASRHAGALASARAELLGAGLSETAIATHDVSHWTLVPWVLVCAAPIAVGVFFSHSWDATVRAAAMAVLGILVIAAMRATRFFGAATFTLKVLCPDPATVGRVLDLTTTALDLDLDRIEWRYDASAQSRTALVQACVVHANERALVVARALNVKLVGVHSFDEEHFAPVGPAAVHPVEAHSVARKSRGALSYGAITNSERARVVVTVRYRVSRIEQLDSREEAAD